MYFRFFRKFVIFVGFVVLIWMGFRFILPIGMPFLLGAILALAAEPAVRLLNSRLRLPRFAATGVGVSCVFLLSITLLIVLAGLLMRQLRNLAQLLPQLEQAVTQGAEALRQWLLDVAAKLPGSLSSVLMPMANNLFTDSGALFAQAASHLPKFATGLLSGLSEGMLGVLTGIISGYMISARLPSLRQWVTSQMPQSFREKFVSILADLRKALGGWLLAEVKLAGISFGLLLLGFSLLKISNSFLWAALVTLVDAFPILGVGTVLIPWSLVCLLQGDTARGIGLLGLYAVIWLVRSILEPKLVGNGLGMDPLVTLIAIYVGFRLLGIPGMLLAPILALAICQIVKRLNA